MSVQSNNADQTALRLAGEAASAFEGAPGVCQWLGLPDTSAGQACTSCCSRSSQYPRDNISHTGQVQHQVQHQVSHICTTGAGPLSAPAGQQHREAYLHIGSPERKVVTQELHDEGAVLV